MNLTTFEKELLGPLLESAAEELQRNSCNDYPITVTPENRKSLIRFIKKVGEDEDNTDHLLKQVDGGTVYFLDWMVLDYFKKKLTGN